MRTEGGHKRGHSNMEHYDTTEAIKDATRKNRRSDDNKAIVADLVELSDLDDLVFGAYLCPLCDTEHQGMCDDCHESIEEMTWWA